MAKGQKRSNREVKKPKKSASEKAKAGAAPAPLRAGRSASGTPTRKV